jgi:hypothetical protein
VARPPLAFESTSLTSLISSAATQRSSVSPVGTLGISLHQSGASPFTSISNMLRDNFSNNTQRIQSAGAHGFSRRIYRFKSSPKRRLR